MKKAILFAITVAVVTVLRADVMNWQVNDSSLAGYNWAQLKWADTQTTTASDDNIIADSALDGSGKGQEKQLDLADLVGAGYNTKYYFIEVGNYTGEGFQVAKTAGAYSYSDLVSAGLVSTGSMNPPSGKTFGQSGVAIPSGGDAISYSDVPEPSSALLMLVGLAVAGLKRRRA